MSIARLIFKPSGTKTFVYDHMAGPMGTQDIIPPVSSGDHAGQASNDAHVALENSARVLPRDESLVKDVMEKPSPTETAAGPEEKTTLVPTMYEKLSPSGTDTSSLVQAEVRTWKTTVLRLGPLSGICSLLLALASIVASLGVLIGSDGAPTHQWTAPPATYLAVFTAIANLAMRYACFQGK